LMQYMFLTETTVFLVLVLVVQRLTYNIILMMEGTRLLTFQWTLRLQLLLSHSYMIIGYLVYPEQKFMAATIHQIRPMYLPHKNRLFGHLRFPRLHRHCNLQPLSPVTHHQLCQLLHQQFPQQSRSQVKHHQLFQLPHQPWHPQPFFLVKHHQLFQLPHQP